MYKSVQHQRNYRKKLMREAEKYKLTLKLNKLKMMKQN